MAPAVIVVVDGGREIAFSPEDMLRYHGYRSPAGVAHAFKVLERAFGALSAGVPVERREVAIETPFAGPGARDAFELVTRAVTEQRYRVDPSMARAELGPARERFVFRLRYRDQLVNLALREGFVSEEFVALADRRHRSSAEEDRLAVLKAETAARVLAARAEAVYDVQ